MANSVKPFVTKASDLNPTWHVVDATDKTLGRLATEIATRLTGKDKPIYAPYLNTGDFVVVTNAEKIRVSGKKLQQKMYYHHSGYHGGLRERTLQQMMDKTPDRVLKQAVKGMLPKNAMGRSMMSRLKVYAGPEHPHEAQIKGSQAKES